MTDSTRRKLYEHMSLIKDIRYPRAVNEYCTLIDINDFPEYWKTKALKDYGAAMHREYWLKEHFSRTAVLMNESVSQSLADDVLRRLRDEYGIENWQINPYELYNGIDGYNIEKKNKNTKDNISLLIPELKNNRDIIITVMKQEGYYLICESPDKLDKATNVDWVVLTFAPYEQYKVNDDVAASRFLYHTTKKSNVISIMDNGLVPQSHNGMCKYPPRTYFYIEEYKNNVYQYAYSLYMSAKEHITNPEKEYVVLRVDFNKLDGIDFYDDPLIDKAVYTTQKISQEFIEVIEEFDVTEKNYVESLIVLTKRESEVKKEIEEEVSKCPNIHFNGRTVYTTYDNFDELMKVKSHLMMKGIVCDSNETLRRENMSFFDVRLRKSDEMKNKSVYD